MHIIAQSVYNITDNKTKKEPRGAHTAGSFSGESCFEKQQGSKIVGILERLAAVTGDTGIAALRVGIREHLVLTEKFRADIQIFRAVKLGRRVPVRVIITVDTVYAALEAITSPFFHKMLLLSAAQALFARFSVRTGIAALFINSLECKKHSFLCACRTGQKCAPVSKRTNRREALFVRGIAGRFVPKQKHQSAAFAGACFRFCRAADEAFSSVVILPFVRARIRVLPLTNLPDYYKIKKRSGFICAISE